MRKITLLFATLLVMSELAFGQKETKLIWETTVDRLPYYSPIGYGDLGKMSISESGNTVLLYPDNSNRIQGNANVKAFDKNGKFMWGKSDFYKNKDGLAYPYSINGKFKALAIDLNSKPDSSILFDKDLNYARSFKGIVKPIIEGAFYTNPNTNDHSLMKYDSKGKEQWYYRNSANTSINILGFEAPYTGLYNNADNYTSRLVRLDENGKAISISESFVFNNTIYAITKSGAWMASNQGYENIEFIRFNNQGKKIAAVPYRNIVSKDIFDSGNVRVKELGDNNLIFVYLKDREIIFTRVDSLGNIKMVSSGSILSDVKYFYGYLGGDIKDLEGKDLMYAIELPEKITEIVRKHKIGVVRFDTPNLSWQKEIISGAYIYRGYTSNFYRFQPDNTFLGITSDEDYSNLKSFKVYDINGTLKWESTFKFYSYQFKAMGDYLYANTYGNNSNLTKVRYSDGKIIWKKEIFNIYNYYEYIRKDDNGNEVIFYQDYDNNTDKYTYKITAVNVDGSTKWDYVLPQNIATAHTDFRFHGGKVIISTLEEDGGGFYKHILRKISPCTDIIATATASNTEACPTEKVKLSILKQEGVTYQWQKDGKDISDLKDAVYDIGESGTYTVKIKDEICQNQIISNALKINIRSLPSAEIQAPKTTFCEGDKTIITAQTNGTFFQWQRDEKDIPNATSGILEVSQTGNYRVGVRDEKCPQLGFSNFIPITIKPLPEAKISTDIKTVIYEPFSVKMTANVGTGLSYQWLKDDVIVPNEITSIYEAKKSGKYNVSVTKDGCLKTSEALNVIIQIPLANEVEINEETVQIYPNPNRGEFKIIIPKPLKGADIQLFDLLGRERTIIQVGEQTQADGLIQGTYFLRVNKGKKSIVNKIVIE